MSGIFVGQQVLCLTCSSLDINSITFFCVAVADCSGNSRGNFILITACSLKSFAKNEYNVFPLT